MSFTPGPWDLDDGDTEAIGVFSASDSNAVCYLSERAGQGVGLRGPEIDKANAHLIATAPEMYALIWKLRDETNCICGLAKTQRLMGTSVECTYCEASALLARAEGRNAV